MAMEPMDLLETASEGRRHRLNSWVAIMVAVLATFMGICKVKDDNIVQQMQQDQAKSVDSWAWYQAKKTRLQFADATVDQLEIQALTAPQKALPLIEKKIKKFKGQVTKQAKETEEIQAKAKGYDDDYDKWNVHDDQFDFSDALLAIAISLFAVTSLTQKRWLFGLALVPTFFGVLYGVAGLLGWALHSALASKLLGT